MDKKNKIRLICAVGSGISTFLITCFLSILIIKTTLGNTVYAISTPLLFPLCIIAALLVCRIFLPGDRYAEGLETEENELNSDEYNANSKETEDCFPQLDESAYPELFAKKQQTETDLQFSRPDIRKLIREQSGESEISVDTDENEKKDDDIEELLHIEAKKASEINSIYNDIPEELPDGYVPYEYEDETDEDEEDDEYEDYAEPRISKVILRIIIGIAASALAVILPINCATVYTADSIKIKRPFSEKEYQLTDADYYTVGVTLTGDLSLKSHFKNGKEFDLVIPSTVIKSDSFKGNFSSEYGYAAFCNRLLKRAEVEKRFDDLTSLSYSSALSQSDIAYIEEITETN